ncbi:MAG: hypothetical protein M3Q61_07160, partial [Chloroflexota bacterium]|nr:hypothetical protein [Chloroflexota bacterium]
RVDVSIDDATFANPVEATLAVSADERSGSWTVPLPRLAVGSHTLYVRACIDRACSATAQRTLTVADTRTTPRVQWQVVAAGATPAADRWRSATGLLSYSFEFDTRTYGRGDFVIHTRLLEGGVPTAATSVGAKLR